MTYEITLEKCGRTVTKTIKNVNSEDEAKLKALILVEEGFHVTFTTFIG